MMPLDDRDHRDLAPARPDVFDRIEDLPRSAVILSLAALAWLPILIVAVQVLAFVGAFE